MGSQIHNQKQHWNTKHCFTAAPMQGKDAPEYKIALSFWVLASLLPVALLLALLIQSRHKLAQQLRSAAASSSSTKDASKVMNSDNCCQATAAVDEKLPTRSHLIAASLQRHLKGLAGAATNASYMHNAPVGRSPESSSRSSPQGGSWIARKPVLVPAPVAEAVEEPDLVPVQAAAKLSDSGHEPPQQNPTRVDASLPTGPITTTEPTGDAAGDIVEGSDGASSGEAARDGLSGGLLGTTAPSPEPNSPKAHATMHIDTPSSDHKAAKAKEAAAAPGGLEQERGSNGSPCDGALGQAPTPDYILHVAMEYSIPHLGMDTQFMFGGLGKVRGCEGRTGPC